MDVDVLVAGGGPAGLTAACGLAAAGLTVRVVDRADGPASTSRANILHARGVEVLTRLKALGDLPAQALEPVGMQMHARGRALATMRFSPDPRESTQAMFISQAKIETELRRRLTELNVDVAWGRDVVAADQDASGVTVGFADGTSLRAGWLIGCDGAHSTVRKLAGIDFPGVEVVEQFLLADVHADWDRPRDVSGGWFHRDGMLLAMPMHEDGADSKLWRLMADVPPAGRRLSPDEIVDRLRGLLAERAGQHGIDIHDTVWTSVFRIQRRLAESYRNGRILLAGDAAHIHSPIGGQGMNTGIGDAENLAWKLGLVATGRAGAELLDGYTAERRPLAAEVLRNTTANTKILAGANLPTRLLRDWFIVPVMKLSAVQRQATRVSSQLGVTYRDGPLGGRGGEPRPGDRIPDRDCRTTDGEAARLLPALGPGWVLLVGAGQDVGVSESTDVSAVSAPEPATEHADSDRKPAAGPAVSARKLAAAPDAAARKLTAVPAASAPEPAAVPAASTRKAAPGSDTSARELADVARHRLGPVTVLHGDGPDVGQAWLIRPDGHLGWRGTDPAELRNWLDQTLLTKDVS